MTWTWTKDSQGNLLGNNTQTCPNCEKPWSGYHEFLVNLPLCKEPKKRMFLQGSDGQWIEITDFADVKVI